MAYYRLDQSLIEAQQIHAPEGQTPEEAGWLQFSSREEAEIHFGIPPSAQFPGAPEAALPLVQHLATLEPRRRRQIQSLKGTVANALILNLIGQGMDPEAAQLETMRLGAQFFDSHGAAIASYIDGSGFRLRSQIASDGRPWLEYPVPGREGLVIRDLFLESLPEGEVGDRCILTDAEALEILTLMDGTLTMAKIKDAIALLLTKLQ